MLHLPRVKKKLSFVYDQTRVLRVLLYRLLILLLVYLIMRAAFLICNYELLGRPAFEKLLDVFAGGFRFDLSILVYINIPIVLLMILPVRQRFNNSYQVVLKWLFYILNIPLLLLAISDIVYFPFVLRRSTADVLGMKLDFFQQLMSYVEGFWFLLPCLAILIFIIEL